MSKKNILPLPSSKKSSLNNFSDLVATKMIALIEKGRSHDFLDIYTLCYEGLTTASQCWQLWREQQTLGGADSKAMWAKMAVLNHVARLAQEQPLEKMGSPAERNAATQIRMWFQTDFLDAFS